jgi:hypothetical protein
MYERGGLVSGGWGWGEVWWGVKSERWVLGAGCEFLGF